MGGAVDRDTLKKNAKLSANPTNLFKGKEKRRDFLNAALDPGELTKTPEPPEPVAVPPPATSEDPKIAEAKEGQLRKDLKRRGRRSSILTSPSGVDDPLGNISRPQARSVLLG